MEPAQKGKIDTKEMIKKGYHSSLRQKRRYYECGSA